MSLFQLNEAYVDVAAALHATSFEHPWDKKEFLSLLSLPTTKGWIDGSSLLLVSHVLDEIEILTILVHPNFRGQGKAFSLLTHLIQYAKQNNVRQIFLEVNIQNTPAISLYEKIGFQKTGIRKNYYKMKDERGQFVFKDALLYTFLTHI